MHDSTFRSICLAMLILFGGLTACGTTDGAEATQASLVADTANACQVSYDCASGAVIQCSSGSGVCNSGNDAGGWVECDGARTSCPAACTCGTTRFTATRTGRGSGCGVAASSARSSILAAMALQCPSGSCNAVETLGECIPLGPNRTDGFRMTVSDTYSCKEPVGCI